MMASSIHADTEPLNSSKHSATIINEDAVEHNESDTSDIDRSIRRKVDLRLCTIAGILCSLNLLDSGVISSAAVTSMPRDLNLTGNRFSVAIFIFTIASICAQLPATIVMRLVGPPIFFSCTTVCFGLITLCTAFISTWKEMIALRVLLGICMSGIYPGLTYLISTWYARRDQQLRYAFLQTGEVIILATGSIVNFGLNQLDGQHGLKGWQYMFIVNGSATVLLGILTFFWIPSFPEQSGRTIRFLSDAELDRVLTLIDHDRKDAGKPKPFSFPAIWVHFLDVKIYAFAVLFFLLNLVSTALSYFLPIILQSGMGYTGNQAILLSAPPYYYAVIPVIISSIAADRLGVRGPIIVFNAVCLIVGFGMLGFARQSTVRYIGTYLATGAYVSNWAALSAYQANNITGQWKRATVAATVAAFNGLGGIAGSYIVRSEEAPRYITAIWVSIGSHILMICIVIVCGLFFWSANKRADRGKNVIEHTIDFRYTY